MVLPRKVNYAATEVHGKNGGMPISSTGGVFFLPIGSIGKKDNLADVVPPLSPCNS
jgi:hypothetical protein